MIRLILPVYSGPGALHPCLPPCANWYTVHLPIEVLLVHIDWFPYGLIIRVARLIAKLYIISILDKKYI